MDTVLKLFKIVLGVTHNARDDYFIPMLQARQAELAAKGIDLDLTKSEDQILLCDYAEWVYKKRAEDAPMPQNLQWRIRNRIAKERCNNGA
jgi:hypothetical protein